MEENRIRELAAIAMLDAGISLPLYTVLRKRPFRLTMKIPTTQSLIRISRLYNKMGITREEYEGCSFDEKVRFVATYGKLISRMIAYGIVRGPVIGALLNRPVARMLRSTMPPLALAQAWKEILLTIDTAPFGSIIGSATAIDKMKTLMTSRQNRS